MDELHIDEEPRQDFEGELCGCGCWRTEHDDYGKCEYCFDCDGFAFDYEGTMMALFDINTNEI